MSGGEERTVLFQLPTVIGGQLICTQGTLAGRSWNLSAGTFVIGRQAGCDLTLAAEPGVSKVHAKIVAEGNHYALVDHESRNGTIVNGRPIQKARLKTGDEIRICNCVLRFTQTEGGFSLEPPPTSSEGEPETFDHGGGTAPELADATRANGAPPSMSASPSASHDSGPAPQAAMPGAPTAMLPSLPSGHGPTSPTAEYVASDAPYPELPPEVHVASAAPWFAVGLLVMVVLGAGSWGALRLFGDALLGPMPSVVAEKGGDAPAPKEPLDAIAEQVRAEEAALAKANAAKDAGAAPGAEAVVAAADAPPDTPAKGDDDAEDAPAAAPDEPVEDATEPAADVKLATAEPKRPATPKRTARAQKQPAEEPATGDDGAAKASAAPPPTSRWYPAFVERDGPLAVKPRAGGTVAAVAASDGSAVRKGDLLFSFEDAGTDEISNLRANIEALEAVAESQPSAQEMLERERDKLKRLLAKGGDVNVTAPGSGTLKGFSVKVGDTLAAGQSVGAVERSGTTLIVTVSSASEGRRIKRGAVAELKTAAGVVNGRVTSTKRRGGGYQITVEADAKADDVTEARFP